LFFNFGTALLTYYLKKFLFVHTEHTRPAEGVSVQRRDRRLSQTDLHVLLRVEGDGHAVPFLWPVSPTAADNYAPCAALRDRRLPVRVGDCVREGRHHLQRPHAIPLRNRCEAGWLRNKRRWKSVK